VTHGFTVFTVFQVSKFMPMAQDALAVELLSCRFFNFQVWFGQNMKDFFTGECK